MMVYFCHREPLICMHWYLCITEVFNSTKQSDPDSWTAHNVVHSERGPARLCIRDEFLKTDPCKGVVLQNKLVRAYGRQGLGWDRRPGFSWDGYILG